MKIDKIRKRYRVKFVFRTLIGILFVSAGLFGMSGFALPVVAFNAANFGCSVNVPNESDLCMILSLACIGTTTLITVIALLFDGKNIYDKCCRDYYYKETGEYLRLKTER